MSEVPPLPALGPLALARGELDRATALRADEAWLESAWSAPGTKVLVLRGDRAPVRIGGGTAELALAPASKAFVGLRLLLGVDDGGIAYFAVLEPAPAGDQAEAGEPPASSPGAEGLAASQQPPAPPEGPGAAAAGLDPAPAGPEQTGAAGLATGVDAARPATGLASPVSAVDTAHPPGRVEPRPPEGVRLAGLREAGPLLGDRDAGLLTHAVALAHWHASHTHCPRCGTPTRPAPAGHLRVCPADGSEHFPRVDPAVITLVTDDRDRCLLARNQRWPPRRVSILAGFVEPGESAEQAVVREVAEETSIVVGDVRYLGSQPWPMPQSLMLGFHARAAGTQTIRVDNEEIAEARWYSRDDVRTMVAAGDLLLPPPVSIAHRIIEAWYGAPLPNA